MHYNELLKRWRKWDDDKGWETKWKRRAFSPATFPKGFSTFYRSPQFSSTRSANLKITNLSLIIEINGFFLSEIIQINHICNAIRGIYRVLSDVRIKIVDLFQRPACRMTIRNEVCPNREVCPVLISSWKGTCSLFLHHVFVTQYVILL